MTAENLNRLLGLAGEARVESRWLQPFADSLQRLKRMHYELCTTLDQLRERLPVEALSESAASTLQGARERALECRQFLSQRLDELEDV